MIGATHNRQLDSRALSMHLRAETVQQLFAMENPHARRESGTVSFTLSCTVLEGTACYFIDENDSSSARLSLGDRDLEGQIVGELGWKFVEHSRGASGAANTVTVRCSRPLEAEGPTSCEVNRGDRWDALPVE